MVRDATITVSKVKANISTSNGGRTFVLTPTRY